MSNMGYCRFENTVEDLDDCYEHFGDQLSPEEDRARKRMMRICKDIIADYGEEEQKEEQNGMDTHYHLCINYYLCAKGI